MIKILRHGDPDKFPNKVKTFLCDTCTCEFTGDKGDYKSSTQYNETEYYAKCPECGMHAPEKK